MGILVIFISKNGKNFTKLQDFTTKKTLYRRIHNVIAEPM